MGIAISSIVGFLLGIFASWLFWRYLLWKKPNVEIASKVSLTKDDNSGKNIYIFKIANKGDNQLIDLTFEATICDILSVPGGEISRGLFKFPIIQILSIAPKGYNKRPWGLTPERNYVSIPDIDINKLLVKPNARILITLRATDALSGTSATQQKTYCKQDIIQGEFAFGESLDIIPY